MPDGLATSSFLTILQSAWAASNSLAFAIRERYPVSPGHTLVITKRPVATWFDASPDEQPRRLEHPHQRRRTTSAAPAPARRGGARTTSRPA